MSCDVSVVVVGPSSMSACAALDRIHELEQRWSRFLPGSEISRLNSAAGTTITVSEDTRRLVVALVEAWHVTDGAFDPTLLVPLVDLGYAASRDDASRRTSPAATSLCRGRPDRVLVNARRSTVELPLGTALDPGGLGKGLAADLVVGELIESGAAGALVEIGGDVRVAGEAPDHDAWAIAVEVAPGGPSELVRLRDGGVATSSTELRTWMRDGRPYHHLLDPRTLRPTSGEVVAATAVAGTARWAEVFTKPAFVQGAACAIDRMDRHGVAGSATTVDGRTCTASWHRYALGTTTGIGR